MISHNYKWGKGDVEVKFKCCDICEEVWGVQLDL